MKLTRFALTVLSLMCAFTGHTQSTRLNDLSADLLLAVQINQPYASFEKELQSYSFETITDSLSTDAQKKAFWINIYNAYTQIRLAQEPHTYKNRFKFFKKKYIKIGDVELSLNDIEHRILRKQRALIGGGYIANIFKKKFANEWQVDSIDSRIHFALNCGATSCPPISFYEPEKINQELNEARLGYLLAETEVDSAEQTIYVPKILSWYRGDFGGKDAILQLLSDLKVVENATHYRLRFKDYNWSLEQNKFADDE